MTEQQLSDALDECLTLLKKDGLTVEECLVRYPQRADRLRPLLNVARWIGDLARPTPGPAAFTAGRRRMLRALRDARGPADV